MTLPQRTFQEYINLHRETYNEEVCVVFISERLALDTPYLPKQALFLEDGKLYVNNTRIILMEEFSGVVFADALDNITSAESSPDN